MAVGLSELPALLSIRGIRLGTGSAGIKKPGRKDMVAIVCDEGANVAAVFTRNRFCAAPVAVAREHLALGAVRACVINSGNANAGTGEKGLADAKQTCTWLAEAAGLASEEVMPFSTGVIGQYLPMDRIKTGIPQCISSLSEAGWADAARGIMTTDTVPKGASRIVEVNDATINLTGIVKGAGMIRPDMATLLVFIGTDARIDVSLLQNTLQAAVARSFNRITVDSDTSTNDACVVMATGQSDVEAVHPGTAVSDAFTDALTSLCVELAQAVVRDAEGANKFVAIEVSGGASEQDCLDVAFTVAHSPLVKTALFASDPNWGRILAAVGRAPITNLDVNKVAIWINGTQIVDGGAVADSYTEEAGQQAMSQSDIHVRIDLGAAGASACVWTSDLSYDYVRINAEYRT